jgi:hypothetical protein
LIIVGIDPGLDGGIVAIDKGTQKILYHKIMPTIPGKRREYDVPSVVRIFEEIKQLSSEMMVHLEKSGKFSKGTLAIASTSFCSGMLQGVLTSLRIPYKLVRPQEWQKQVLKGLSGDTKQASILWATRKYPEFDFRRSERCRTPYDGLCDALGLAHYTS